MTTPRRRAPRNLRRINPGARDQLRKRILREESHCHLCGEPVDVKMGPHQPGSPEVDEIIPVSKGGSPTLRSNTRLAHRACNLHRSNMDLDQYLQAKALSRTTPTIETTITDRRWWDAQGEVTPATPPVPPRA